MSYHHEGDIIGSVVGLIFMVVIVWGITACIKGSRSRRMNNMQVTTVPVVTMQQPVLQPQVVMEMPVNTGYIQQQPQMVMGQGMNQMQYQ